MTLNRLTLIRIRRSGFRGKDEQQGIAVQVEGELRSREYDRNGVTQKIFECRVGSILKLDRAIRQEEPNDNDDPAS